MDEKRTEDKGVALRIDERITLISLTLNTVGAASNGVGKELQKAVVKPGTPLLLSWHGLMATRRGSRPMMRSCRGRRGSSG